MVRKENNKTIYICNWCGMKAKIGSLDEQNIKDVGICVGCEDIKSEAHSETLGEYEHDLE